LDAAAISAADYGRGHGKNIDLILGDDLGLGLLAVVVILGLPQVKLLQVSDHGTLDLLEVGAVLGDEFGPVLAKSTCTRPGHEAAARLEVEFAPIVPSELGGATVDFRERVGRGRQSSAAVADASPEPESHRHLVAGLVFRRARELMRKESLRNVLIAGAHHYVAAGLASILPD
jgi:hypothetical protein